MRDRIYNILLYGLILFDNIEGREYIGGPAINIALHMAHHNFPSLLVSCVGDDKLGKTALSCLADNGITTDYVNTSSKYGTGWVKVLLNDEGNPTFDLVRPVAFDYISLTDKQMEELTKKEFDLFYFGSIVQRNITSAETLKKMLDTLNYRETFVDINLRIGHYTKEVIDYTLSKANILKLNEDELWVIANLFNVEEELEAGIVEWIFRTYPPHIVILTRGPNGASIFTHDDCQDIPGIKVTVKDTVGSGDAFSAGFIMEYIRSGNILLAAQKGNELGAYVASRSGAVPELNE